MEQNFLESRGWLGLKISVAILWYCVKKNFTFYPDDQKNRASIFLKDFDKSRFGETLLKIRDEETINYS